MMGDLITVEELVVRDERGVRIACLWLDDRNGRGRVVLFVSGNVWTYTWPTSARGNVPLGRWLSDRSNVEYIARKMGAADWFDRAATTAEARRLVCRDRRDNCLDRDEARELFEAAGHLRTEADAAGWFHDYCRQSRQMDTWEDNPVQHAVDPEFRRAWLLLLPALRPSVERAP